MTAPATAAIPSQPVHPALADRTAVYLEALRHDVQTTYGQLLHAEHDAQDRHDTAAQDAYHHAAGLLARLMWVEAA